MCCGFTFQCSLRAFDIHLFTDVISSMCLLCGAVLLFSFSLLFLSLFFSLFPSLSLFYLLRFASFLQSSFLSFPVSSFLSVFLFLYLFPYLHSFFSPIASVSFPSSCFSSVFPSLPLCLHFSVGLVFRVFLFASFFLTYIFSFLYFYPVLCLPFPFPFLIASILCISFMQSLSLLFPPSSPSFSCVFIQFFTRVSSVEC
jgi:hypothetical protein